MSHLRVSIEGFKEALLRGSYLDAKEILKAEMYAHDKGMALPEALVDLKLLTKDLIGQIVAQSVGLKYADQDAIPLERDVIQTIDEATAKTYRVVYLHEDAERVAIASDKPSEEALQAIGYLFPGKAVDLYFTLSEYLDTAFKLYGKPLASRFQELFVDPHASIPDVVSAIFDYAVDAKASDIHFEPRSDDVAVRFRIDGVLVETGRIPKNFYERILNRIKVLAQLPIDEHFRAMDGSLRLPQGDGLLNLRVSIAPTVAGEKIAIRILSAYFGFSIENLGLTDENFKILSDAAQKPFGMILVTGPTGSGKTTTLYTFLSTLNRPEVNITSIEDPVEYRLEGVNQMQTNEAIGLTFPRGLRTIVRQDPDIVLVGEIRDRETAEISVNAALTGHLLFSTFHSNDASTTIPRLLDMGIEPFLLSSTLELVIAQRLIRKICDNCKTTYSVDSSESAALVPLIRSYFQEGEITTLYKGKGCQACHMSGYRMRTGIYEMIRVTPELQGIIVRRPTSADIWKIASSQGARSLFSDGFEKVKKGETTLEELLRVAQPSALA